MLSYPSRVPFHASSFDSSRRYTSTAESMRLTGKYSLDERFAASSQSCMRMQIAVDSVWTASCVVNGGICESERAQRGVFADRKNPNFTWESYIWCRTSHASAYGTPHWTKILGTQPGEMAAAFASWNLTRRRAICPGSSCKLHLRCVP